MALFNSKKPVEDEEAVGGLAGDKNPILKRVAPKDGKLHVLMMTSFGKLGNVAYGCDTKYTGEVDPILGQMQDAGYEIVDVKVCSTTGQGLSGGVEKYNTLIMYR